MYDLQLAIFGIIIAALVLAWGLLMALSPTRFWDLARVDWNADVVDTRDRGSVTWCASPAGSSRDLPAR